MAQKTTIRKAQAGVPAGGTTGQALVKLSNTDLNTGWGTPSSGNVPFPIGTISGGGSNYYVISSAYDSVNNVIYVLQRNTAGPSATIVAYAQDATSGIWYANGNAATIFFSANQYLCVNGSTVYCFGQSYSSATLITFALDLSGASTVNVNIGSGNNYNNMKGFWVDGTYMYSFVYFTAGAYYVLIKQALASLSSAPTQYTNASSFPNVNSMFVDIANHTAYTVYNPGFTAETLTFATIDIGVTNVGQWTVTNTKNLPWQPQSLDDFPNVPLVYGEVGANLQTLMMYPVGYQDTAGASIKYFGNCLAQFLTFAKA